MQKDTIYCFLKETLTTFNKIHTKHFLSTKNSLVWFNVEDFKQLIDDDVFVTLIMQIICNKQKNDLDFKGTRIWFANLFVFCLPALFLFNINENMYTYWLSLTIVWRYLTLEHTGGFFVLRICFVHLSWKMFHCTVSNLELTIRVLAIVAHLEFILAWQIIFFLRLVFFFTKGSLKLLLTVYKLGQ